MSFRKTLCLLAALVFGVSATAFAQVADPIGIRVRVVSPDSAGYAGIGKTIKVDVLRLKNLAPSIDSVIVALRPDTTGPFPLQSPIAAGAFSADSLGLTSSADDATKRFVDTLTAVNGSGTAVDTFHFTFTVTVGDPDNGGLGAKVLPVVFVREASTTSFKKLSALNTLPMSTISTYSDPVGDKKFLLVDGLRPVASSVFDSVLIDTVAASTNFPGSTYRAFKIGDQVKLHMHVHGFNAAKARVGIYEASMVGQPDSALYTKDFSASEVVSAVNGVRDSFTLASGQFKRAGLQNNLRTHVLAFLVDNAGNVSNPSSSTGAAAGFSQDITYVFDTNPPVVTLVYPDSSGKRFTGRVDTTLALRLNDGSVNTTATDLKPLKFRVNEGTKVRWAIVGTDTAMYGGTSDTATAGVKVVTTDSFSAVKGKAAGASVDLSVVAFDSVGNKTTKSLSGVTLDQVAPLVSNLFPASASLPDNKINNITRHPVFQISEVADTISVRYVQVGSTPPNVVTQSVSSSKLSTVGSDINVTVNDSLLNGEKYTLQVFIKDLAQNVNVTPRDTLTFDKAFSNPVADSFVVTSNEDSVLAGQGMKFSIAAIDSKLTRQASTQREAVTYGKTGVLVRLSAGSQDLSGVSFWGKGVTDNGNGTANLDAASWALGKRDVWVKSTKSLDSLSVSVEDTSTTVVDGNATKVVNFKGGLKNLTVDAADFRKFMVVAMDNGQSSSTGVQGDFQVKVTPTDWWGNPSLKAFKTATSTRTDSISLLDTRLASKPDSTKNLLEQVAITFGSNMGDAQVPSGSLPVGVDGATFTAVAPNRTGEGLVISVKTAYTPGDSSGQLPQSQAVGSVTLAFSGDGVPIPSGNVAPAAPKNLVVQDYKGADGKGDQGFYVMVSFPASMDHAKVSQYRLYRELNVTTRDSAGLVVTTAPVAKWVAWTAIDPVDTTIVRAIVPVTDNVATRWAVASESGKTSSEQVVAGKRVFTKESVQQMAGLLGVDPNRIVSPEDLSQMFMPSADYVKSLVGDKKNVIVAALDPDVASLMGANTVPTSIRTSGDAIVSSEKTLAADAVAAKDNLKPAAVTDAKITGSQVTWTASTDDHVVGSVTYRGYAIPIAGVTNYQIMGGSSATALEPVGTVPSGSTSFTFGSTVPNFVQVNALDLDNTSLGNIAQGGITYKHFTNASGNVYIVVLTGATTPYLEDFEDFISFASAFNAQKGDANYILQADTDQSGQINFADFLNFASTFNQTATQVDGQPVPSAKPVIQSPGVNENTQFSLSQGSDRVLAGQTMTVNVSLSNAKALEGYGFVLNYDADKFQYVNAAPATKDLLKSTGGETPLFLAQADQPGQVTVANAVVNGSAVSGSGDVVNLTFKVLKEFQDQARFEIANGVVFDPKQLSNPAVVAGVLNLQSTPSEFALLQNFPNPFNPETTINYNLASSSDVTLQIYNVVGQVVKTLVAERQNAGRYQVRWNGTDDRGMSVSSGIYFYSIRAGKFEDVRKLMLLK